MERNTELFYEVAQAIEEDPDGYNQNYWELFDTTAEKSHVPYSPCKTQRCVAGWACYLREDQMAWNFSAEEARRTGTERMPLGGWLPIAADLLMLDDEEANLLFGACWRPHEGLSVPDALRKIGEGAVIEDLTEHEGYNEEDDEEED